MKVPRLRELRLSEWVMAACILVAAFAAIWNATIEVHQPFQMDYGEGVILNAGLRITQGLPLYPDPTAYPTVLNPYGPVGYYLVAACVRVGGVSFTWPRMAMLGSGLLVALLLILLIEHWTGSWMLAATFGLFFLTTRAMLLWSPLLRVDLLAIAISLAGFVVWFRAPRFWWPFAVLLFSLALFVKPTALPAPAACFFSMVASREWKRALRFAGLLALLCAAGLAWMQLWTGGHFFFHVFRSHPDLYTVDNLLHLFAKVILSFVPLFAFLGAFFFVKGKSTAPVLFYLLCSFIVVVATGGKAGSSINHLLELIAACCLAGAIGYQWLAQLASRPRFLPVLGCALGAVALYQAGLSARDPHPNDFTYSGCQDLYRSVRESPATNILSENVGALVLAGKRVSVAEPFLLAQMVEHGLLAPQGIERRVANREFSLIVLNSQPAAMQLFGSDRWWPALVDALDRNYHVVRSFDCKDGNVLLEPGPEHPVGPARAAAAAVMGGEP